jgi:hypothetical protein
VRIRNSFVPVDFVVLEMDVCRQIPLILERPFLSTTEATIDVATRIIKLNMSRKEETSTFKPKGTKKYNQVMVMIRPERNAMTPDKKPSAAEKFSTKFSRRVKNATLVATISPDHEGQSSERAALDHLPLAYHFLFDWDKSGYSTKRTLFHKDPHHRSTMRWIMK